MATKKSSNGLSKKSPRPKLKSRLAEELARGLEEVLAHKRGEIQLRKRVIEFPDNFVNVRDIRSRTGLSQAKFAEHFGFNQRTLQEWEQGRAFPDRALMSYLKVIDRAPKAVELALVN